MPIALYFAVPSAIIVIVSVPIYLLMLWSHQKYRKKVPFNSTFFVLSFHHGIVDLLHLFNDWVIGMLPYLGLHAFIVKHANIFAKQYSLVWWYTAWAQKMGVLLLAVDRLASMWFGHKMTPMETNILIAINWIVPAVLTSPQAFFNFGYLTFNDSNGLLLYWENPTQQYIYFFFCNLYCLTTSLVCGVSYGLTFYKVWQNQQKTTAASRRSNRSDAKLAIVGCVLFVMTFGCGLFCVSLVAFEMSFNVLLFMMGLLQIVMDCYCCISPYLILFCSKAAMNHFLAVIFRKAPETFESRIFTVTPMSKMVTTKAEPTVNRAEEKYAVKTPAD